MPPQHNPQVMRRLLRFSRFAGGLMVLVALAVLAGWRWDMPLLTAAIPDQQTMKATTAVGFVLSGLALLASLRPGRLPCGLCRGLSLAVLVLGAVNLAQYLWPLDLGIDHLFPDPYALAHGLPPGRMSQAAAAGFVLLGLMGFLASSRRWLWLRETVAVALLALAMLSLASYGLALAGETSKAFTPLAIHTAVLLLVATLGWMSSHPTIGLTRIVAADSLGGAFARRLLLPSLLLPVLFTFAFKVLQSRLGASEVFALSLAALFTGGTIAWMVWWVANLLDRVERQRRESETLRDDASTDALTGLPNRRAFDVALAELLRGRRSNDAPFSLLLLDLDKFKDYNDDFGHQAGDDALHSTGRLLRAALRPSDLPARYGGEEFALLLPGTDAIRAQRVAERILADFRAFAWPLRLVTVSIGVAEARPDEGVQALVHRADEALYDAKRAGRNQAMLAAEASAGESPPPRAQSAGGQGE